MRTKKAVMLVAALLVVSMAAPASAEGGLRQMDVGGGGGVIDPGVTLALYEFHADSGGLELNLRWWFDVESEEDTEGVDPDCQFDGDGSDLSFSYHGTSALIEIDGADTTCDDTILAAQLEVSAHYLHAGPIVTSDGCPGVRRHTGESGRARVYIDTQDHGVILDATGSVGSGFLGVEEWVCPPIG